MRNNVNRTVLCFLLTTLFVGGFCARAQENKDWKVVARNVRIVNYDEGISRKGDVYKNVINGKYTILPEPKINETMYYVEYSDNPFFRYMFIYGNEFFGKKWYFNVKHELQLPIENDIEFVRVIKAYCGPRSKYYRLFRSVVDQSLTVVGDDPYFSYVVFSAGDSQYRYKFSQSGLTWYFD